MSAGAYLRAGVETIEARRDSASSEALAFAARVRKIEIYLEGLGKDLYTELLGDEIADEALLAMIEAEIAGQGWNLEDLLVIFTALIAIGKLVLGVETGDVAEAIIGLGSLLG